jgi:hypothetical protein
MRVMNEQVYQQLLVGTYDGVARRAAVKICGAGPASRACRNAVEEGN